MATLDASIVNIALPTLSKELNSPIAQIKWVVVVYLLVITCMILPFGRLSDQFGRKRVFMSGFILFIIGSFFCAFAQRLGVLCLARMLQGIGASMLMANGPAIITEAFPSNERGKALGTLSMVVSLGLISGPVLGGAMVMKWGWTSIFWVNIPVGIAGALQAWRAIRADPPFARNIPFDWAGALLQFVVILLFIVLVEPPMIALSGGEPMPVPRPIISAATILFFALFLKVEAIATAPLFDLGLMKIRTFWTANLASFLTFVSFSAVSVLMPFFLEEVLKLEPDRAGVMMTAIPFTVFLVAPIAGRFSDRFGARGITVLGAFVGALGMFGMSGIFGGGGITEGSEKLGVILALCSIGLATGLFQSPNNNAIMGVVPSPKLGVASALIATVRNLGLVTGTGLATAVFSWRMHSSGNFVSSIHFAFGISGAVALAAVFASFGKRPGGSHG